MSRYVSLLLALTACGGGFNSSLDGDTLLTALTPAELCTLEEEQEDYTADQVSLDAACYLAGQFAGAFAGDDYAGVCQTTYDTCVAAEPTAAEPFVCSNAVVLDTCTATVAELEACAETFAEVFGSALEDAACTEPDPNATPVEGDATCTTLATNCGI